MILRRFQLFLASIAMLGFAAAAVQANPRNPAPAKKSAKAQARADAQAQQLDEVVLHAHAAFRTGDSVKFSRAVAGVDRAALERHVLAPYVEYWRLKLRLDESQFPDVEAYLQKHAGSYLADRLRADWVRELGRRGDWPRFERELAPLVNDDLEIRCYNWLARLERGDPGVYEEARVIWREPRELPESCATLAGKKLGNGEATPDAVWQRIRLLLENNQLNAARRAANLLPAGEQLDEKLLQQASASPGKLIASPPRNVDKRPAREMLLFAYVRLARGDPSAAAEALQGPGGTKLPDADRRYLWGRIGYEGARRLMPEALGWYRLAEKTEMSDEQLAWKARAALRAGDWQRVRDAIDPMSAAARQDAAWSYWYGRALGAQNNTEGARAYFLRISAQPNFYGQLAAEELGYIPAPPEPFHVPTEEQVAAAQKNPGLQRALALYRLGLRPEGTREWFFTIGGMDDAQLIAAAELANRNSIYDRAINTADRTASQHNYRYRFLAPFRDVFRANARAFELEEAWVLGLVRQESRFITDARSSVGAQGLMQLMPATAKWVAKKLNMANYSQARVAEVDVNVQLGTRYLKLVLDDLGHPVLASAAYNAGPGRARRWRDAKPLEGAIYAESIPFNETRDYVKKVMSNAMYYALVYEGKSVPLKTRLGTIPARSSADRFNEDLP